MPTLSRSRLDRRAGGASVCLVDDIRNLARHMSESRSVPMMGSTLGSEIIPAESVYAVFEVKQALNANTVEYAHAKLASVCRLHRTTLPIPSANGMQSPATPKHILGGLLTLASDWRPPLDGQALRQAIASAEPDSVIDFICVAGIGTLERAAAGDVTTNIEPGAAARFLLTLIARLQDIGTVPMLDVRAYANWLQREQ